MGRQVTQGTPGIRHDERRQRRLARPLHQGCGSATATGLLQEFVAVEMLTPQGRKQRTGRQGPGVRPTAPERYVLIGPFGIEHLGCLREIHGDHPRSP